MSMVFRALMMTNNIVLLTGLTMVITFIYVTFCHKQQYFERTYLSYHQRQYSERTYDNTCFLPIELLMTISYENMILNKSMILHLYNLSVLAPV